jgi:hypothetical protein
MKNTPHMDESFAVVKLEYALTLPISFQMVMSDLVILNRDCDNDGNNRRLT